MISSREQISDLIKEYLHTQYEYVAQYWSEDVPEWDGKKQALYSNGVVLGKFREKDKATMNLLKEGVTDSALIMEISSAYKAQIKEKEGVLNLNIIDRKIIETQKNFLREISVNMSDDLLAQNFSGLLNGEEQINSTEFRVLIYLYYVIQNINREREHPCCTDSHCLDELYQNKIHKKSQFGKYGLLPIDDLRELMIIDPPRIYDKSVDQTLFLRNIPKELLQQLSDMKNEGLIGDLALRVSNYEIYSGKVTCQYLCEAVEMGRVFSLSELEKCSVSKLYSEQYDKHLWVIIDSNNITFEETCDDFEVYENFIVTQVVHLEYIVDSNEAYITHLDHEYIFYTEEEYLARCKDAFQKGDGQTRLKSFKVDNARIPFLKRCVVENKDEYGNVCLKGEEQFIYYVLDCYFSHKDLLKEYFQKIRIED